MNPFVYACITPHGGEIIPELQGHDPKRMSVTRENMIRLGEQMSEARPDSIIVITPHGTRVTGQFSITDSERMEGSLEENGTTFHMEKAVDRELAKLIHSTACKNDIPAAAINFGTAAGPISCLPLDWGVMVPLRFMPDVPIVVINPTRELPFEEQIRFGQALRQSVEQFGKRVALIASCDWAHAHSETGPYGYDPAAAPFDQEVVELINKNQLEKMAEFPQDYIDAAKPDGIWQTLILAGAIKQDERNIEFLSYEAPTYFGLITAAIHTV